MAALYVYIKEETPNLITLAVKSKKEVKVEIDVSTTADFITGMQAKLANDVPVTKVMLDIGDVGYIDSCGAWSLFELSKDLRVKGTDLVLINVPDVVRNILKTTGFDKHISLN